MDVFDLLPRADNLYHGCASGKQWYVCSKGDYSGCCSSDPCTTGICPDDNSAASSTTTSSTKSSSTETTTSTSKTSTETKTSISPLPTTSTFADATTVQTTTSTASATGSITAPAPVATATSSSSLNTHSSNHAAIIGGVVGSIAALALSIILFFLCWRRKRKQGRILIGWPRNRTNTSNHDPEMTSSPGTNFSRSTNDTSCLNTSSTTASESNPSDSSAGLLTGSSFESSTLNQSNQQKTSSKDLTFPPETHPDTTTTCTFPTGVTAELSDTGFWRTHCELPHSPQRELINLSLSQRRRKAVQQQFQQSLSRHQQSTLQRWDFPSSTRRSPRGSSQDCLASAPPLHTPRQIITKEGVVLGANMDRYSTASDFTSSSAQAGTGKGKDVQQQRAAHDHVMSFMQYDNATGTGGQRHAVELPWTQRPSRESLVRKTSTSGAVAPVPASKSMPSLALFQEDEVVYSPSDTPPAYAAEEGVSPKDVKSPSATMG
ncbi:hypothetical protein N7474_005866 [Penicillium riverlandense]|uniref:uncharacterized protein n=1 Tax=Penicillium riverlandense TaxID=1903569 RepID=UPI00254985E0|nr:uncharacterized protein N7474_005866 [Penicillium riverlandense]KAJ5820275.1 hypothetical protein N7474_005866 [Penicillium riverlandense]